jgi:tRNA nucleotidyltransferase (CCA-adding enzyme)
MPKNVEFILDKLNTKYESAYIVGGCVRDSIMGVTPHDWDICTSATPSTVKEIFKDYRIIDTGIKHGTVTIIIDDEQYEITTYRIDGIYEDNRHPSDVLFTKNIEADLSRRDFTMNAIAYNHINGFVDPFGGMNDIKNCIIRCVGNPHDRFTEDALRILRAERFAMTLRFQIEDKTEQAMMENKWLLKNIAIERVTSELWKAVSKITYVNERFLILLRVVLPEFISSAAVKEIDYVLNRIPSSGYVTIAFIQQIVMERNPRMFIERPQAMMDKLRFSNKDRKTIMAMCNGLNNILDQINNDVIGVVSIEPLPEMKLLMLADGDYIKETIELSKIYIRYLQMKSNHLCDYVFEMERKYSRAKQECHSLKDLEINGDDLIRMGFKGVKIGEILNDVLMKVIFNQLRNNSEVLTDYVKRNYLFS